MTTRKPQRRNIRKLLARLNPKGMTFQPGSYGGIPAETALDIAAATGMAGQAGDPQRLAVVALCLRWWPGMFEGPMIVVGHRTMHHRHKLHEALKVPIKEHVPGCCERIPIEAPSETPAFGRIAGLVGTLMYRRIHRDLTIEDANLHAQLKAAMHGERAPRPLRQYGRPLPPTLAARIDSTDTGFVARWARVVIHEYRNPNHCQACQMWGRVGMVPKATMEGGKITDIKWEKCEPCMGQGVVSWSAHRRAAALRIGNHPFRDYLAIHHDGALSLLRTLEDRGAALLLRRLGHPDD